MSNQLTYREKLGHSKYIDPGIDCSKDEPLTEQHHKDDCDINTLLARYEKTGMFPETPQNIEDAYGDFSDIPDLQTVLTIGIQAQEAFMELPATTRKKFHNDPAKLWDFIHDPSNDEEARKLGLKTPKLDEPVSVSTVTSSKAGASKVGSDAKGADKKKPKTEESED